MAYSSVTYAGDGVTSIFSTTFSFLDEDHVEVYLNLTRQLPSAYKWVTDSSIQFRDPTGAPNPPEEGQSVYLKRVTPIASRLVVFSPGSVLTETNLNQSALQLFYLVQEAQEHYNLVLDAAVQDVATGAGVVPVDGETVLDAAVGAMMDSAAAAVIAQRIADIDGNASEILVNLGYITTLQGQATSLASQVTALAGSIASTVLVQATEPVPGVGNAADPITDTTRWYDSDDNNHPYIWLPLNLVDAAYKWTTTGVGSEFYIELAAGGDPAITQPQQVEENDVYMTAGTAGSLAAGEWDWATGAWGFNTIVVRLSDSTDPDSKAADYVEAYWWNDLLDPRIGVNAADILVLEASMVTAEGDIVTNAAAIVATDATVTSQGGLITANAGDITALEATVNNATTGVAANASAVSSLQAQVTSNDGDITAISSLITTLQTDVTAAEGTISGHTTAISALDTRITTNEGDISTQSASITALQSEVDLRGFTWYSTTPPTAYNVGDLWVDTDDDNSLHRWNGTTWDPIVQTVVAANAAAISILETDVSVIDGTVTSHSSSITSLQSQITSNDGEIASAAVTIAGHTTAIATAEGDVVALEARYGVTLNVNGFITGFLQNNDGDTGTFDILTNSFNVIDPGLGAGGVPISVFSIESGNVLLRNLYLHQLVVGATGFIRQGQTAYDTGTGFFLGTSGGTTKFSIGSSTGNRLTWDGTTLSVFGEVSLPSVFNYITGSLVVAGDPTQEDHVGLDDASWTEIRTWKMRGTGSMRVRVDAEGWDGSPTKTRQFMDCRVTKNGLSVSSFTTTWGAARSEQTGTSTITWTDPDDVFAIEMKGADVDGVTPFNRIYSYECITDLDYGSDYTT